MSGAHCLDDSTVLALLEGDLPEKARARVDTHVDSCPHCFRMLADLGRVLENDPPAAPITTLAAGAQIDQYRVIAALGRGGMGEVWLAEDTTLKRRVALKLLGRDHVRSPEAIARFAYEARITAQLNHPNIVTIHGLGRIGERPYVALEHVDGVTLRERMKSVAPGPDEALRWGVPLAEAVAAAHERGVWHRDLKPANLVIGRDERLRVLDFGLAKLTSANDDEASGDPAVTLRGGTPLYMAPEQWGAEPVGSAADVWALGVILFELCSGRHPFFKRSDSAGEEGLFEIRQIRQQVCSSASAPPLGMFADTPERLSTLVAACLSKDPADRPAAEHIARFLREIRETHYSAQIEDAPTEDAPPAPAAAPQPAEDTNRPQQAHHERRAYGRLMLPLAALLGAGLLALWVGRSSRAPADETASTATVTTAPPSPPTAAASAASAAASKASSALPQRAESDPQHAPAALSSTSASAVGSASTAAINGSAPPPSTGAAVVATAAADPCRGSAQCATKGQCTASPGGGCVATRDQDCAASSVCRSYGACAARDGQCAATSAQHCKASQHCRTFGRCTPSAADGACWARSDVQCRASERCRSHGACALLAGRGLCRPANDADCRASSGCLNHGRCSAESASCTIASDADCRRSQACQAQGRCRLQSGPSGRRCVE